MHTHSIAPANWKNMFDSLTRVYDGSTATLEILRDDLGAQMEIEDEPLRGIAYDRTGIQLFFVTRDGRHLTHSIPHPKTVAIEEGDDGLVSAIQIASDDDPVAVVRLSAPVASKLLPTGEA
jgi:uncharacterized protein DUF5335